MPITVYILGNPWHGLHSMAVMYGECSQSTPDTRWSLLGGLVLAWDKDIGAHKMDSLMPRWLAIQRHQHTDTKLTPQ